MEKKGFKFKIKITDEFREELKYGITVALLLVADVATVVLMGYWWLG